MANRLNPSRGVLFPAFLEDPEVYQLAESFWQMHFEALFSSKNIAFQRYYNNKLPGGKKDLSGNPIFDAYFPQQHKLVRIIQFIATEPDQARFDYWEDSWPAAELDPALRPTPDDPAKTLDPIPELVIALELSTDTAEQARALLEAWIRG